MSTPLVYRVKRSAPNPRCDICNRFMSWDDVRHAVAWTPFAHGFQYELPDEEFAHKQCWKQLPDSDRQRIRRVAWIPVSCEGRLA